VLDIDVKDIITLSDKHSYVVTGKTNYQDNTYYYLVDKDNLENIKFCVEKSENNSVIEIDDKDLIQQLLPLFLESATKSITKEELELVQQYQDFNETN